MIIITLDDITSIATIRSCTCGSTCKPQSQVLRVPGTHRATVHHIFCFGCKREGVGISHSQAVNQWNESLKEQEKEQKIDYMK